jgi:hypothetical protein
MSSVVEICNTALVRIGVTEFIDDLADQSTNAELCSLLYPIARDLTLAKNAWKFAVRRVALAAAAGTAPLPWAYQFRLPADCITALEIERAIRATTHEQLDRFDIESDATGGLFLCDVEAPTLRYVARVEDSGRFSPPFVDAVAWRLAYDLAVALKVSRQVRDNMLASWLIAVGEAGVHSRQQAQQGPAPDAAQITGRL